ncbi:GGDEF domain-containing protein [Nocardioides sp. BGMRC 2183]|nr:GGDEF domain-containing protein [Nocardioides sp. BGMRC 2183]
MDPLGWMQPRNHGAAARSISTLAGVAATTTILTSPFHSAGIDSTTLVPAGLTVLAVVLLGVGAHRLEPRHRLGWALIPVGGVIALVALDLVTADAGLTAQVFFLFPALYGASQLRIPGAAVTAALCILGEIVVVTAQLPIEEAVIDAWYVAAAIGTSSVLLATTSERHARLVLRLEELAAVDPLTGLATRRVLDQAARSALSGAGSTAGTGLVLIDIDHFKAINDRHGHPNGDAVLAQLAGVLLAHRAPSEVACRLGGDEIAVLMPACDPEASLARAQRLFEVVDEHSFRSDTGEPLEVSISMGCAHLPTHAIDFGSLYTAADAALYQAKREGRGRVTMAAAVPLG